nr:DUF559 domain-containing protein [Microbacterium immunditiarum]
MTRRRLASAAAEGRLIRVRKGRYLRAGTDSVFVRAARLGGRVDCASLVHHIGVFVRDTPHLHIQMDPDASRVPARPDDVVRHWRPTRASSSELATSVVEALVQATRCQEPRAAVATLDSAWHLGLIDEGDLAVIFSALPRRYRVLRQLLDRRSESGPETLVRLILRAIGCRVDVQVQLTHVGRVDFVVDEWLIIECDSGQFHSDWEAQKRDRRRDLAAARLGYSTVRLLAEDVMWHADAVQSALREIIARGPGAHRRAELRRDRAVGAEMTRNPVVLR